MESRNNTPFRIGGWTVWPDLLRLEGPEGSVQVEPKMLAVLVALVSHRGEVVSLDQLMHRVWDGEAVSEAVVRRAVYQLRKVFGDDPSDPKYIETIPRSGYRCVAEIDFLKSEAPLEGERPTGEALREPIPRSAPRQRRPFLWIALLVAAILAFLLRSSWEQGDSTSPRAFRGGEIDQPSVMPLTTMPLTTMPLTTMPGLEYRPDLSPDGRRVLFERKDMDGKPLGIFLQLMGEANPIALVADGVHPTWAPDGTRIAFQRRGKGKVGIYTISALGGSERRLLSFPDGTQLFAMDWSPNGQYLAFSKRSQVGEPAILFRLSLSTLELLQVSFPSFGVLGDGDPSWSPDSRRISFLRTILSSGLAGVYWVPSGGGSENEVVPPLRRLTDVEWSRSGTELMVALYAGGTHRVGVVPVEGGDIQQLSPSLEGAQDLSQSSDGRFLAYSRWNLDFRFRRIELKSGEITRLPVVSSTLFDSEVDISSSGQLAFSSTRSGEFEIWLSDEVGGQRIQLTEFGGPYTAYPRWSPDGQLLAFTSMAGGSLDVWLAPVVGGVPRQLTGEGSHDLLPTWSRDGHWIYFASDRGGDWQIWRQARIGGTAEKLTEDGGWFAQQAANGGSFYFTQRFGDGLFERLDTGQVRKVSNDPIHAQWGNWRVTPQGVFLIALREGRPVVLLLDPATSEERILAELDSWPINPSLAIAPKADWLMLSEVDSASADLMLLHLAPSLERAPDP